MTKLTNIQLRKRKANRACSVIAMTAMVASVLPACGNTNSSGIDTPHQEVNDAANTQSVKPVDSTAEERYPDANVLILNNNTVSLNGEDILTYDYTWHCDPSAAHDEVKNAPAEYYTGEKPDTDAAAYIDHELYYYPQLPENQFKLVNYDGEQEWAYYYTDGENEEYIFATLPHLGDSVPTTMMHSEEEAAANQVLHITQAGTYILQGKWTGQIRIDLGEEDDVFSDPNQKVTLILDGAEVECSVAPGIVFASVYECDNAWEDRSEYSAKVDTTGAGAEIILADGTQNIVTGTNVFRMLKTKYKETDSTTDAGQTAAPEAPTEGMPEGNPPEMPGENPPEGMPQGEVPEGNPPEMPEGMPGENPPEMNLVEGTPENQSSVDSSQDNTANRIRQHRGGFNQINNLEQVSTQKKMRKTDSALYSYMSMNITGDGNGTGALTVNSGFEGIDSELHMSILGGNITINSQDDGMNVNEDHVSTICFLGGNVKINGAQGEEGDGVDSNGFIWINGGTVDVDGIQAPDSALDSEDGIVYDGGTVIIDGQEQTYEVGSTFNESGRGGMGGGNRGDFQNGMKGNRPDGMKGNSPDHTNESKQDGDGRNREQSRKPN